VGQSILSRFALTHIVVYGLSRVANWTATKTPDGD